MFCLAMRRQTYLHLGAARRALRGRPARGRRLRRPRPRGRLPAALRRGRRRPPLRRGLLRPARRRRRVRAASCAPTSSATRRSGGTSWEPYGRRPEPALRARDRAPARGRQRGRAAGRDGARGQPRRRGAAGARRPRAPCTSRRPQDGGWAGHHPADSEEAIGHLEALREDGAELPGRAADLRWWLSHYDGLREHLDRRYQAVVSDERAGAIYLPRGGSAMSARLDRDPRPRQRRS